MPAPSKQMLNYSEGVPLEQTMANQKTKKNKPIPNSAVPANSFLLL